METLPDSNEAIWKSAQHVRERATKTAEREQRSAAQWRLLGLLLPFDTQDEFTFADLGAGTGSAARAILAQYPRSTAVLADFSAEMIAVGTQEMQPFEGRYRYVEFDMSTPAWPAAIPAGLDAVVTSMSVHHLPDARKEGLFAEIFDHLRPGGWYVNYDSVRSADPAVSATWVRVADREDPLAADARARRTPAELARRANHERDLIPLAQQLDYLRAAGYRGIDVYWKHLDDVVIGGYRPA
ncbi:class I SAM-dependent methyltransferase [Pengzhenrongella sicca]|uniref:Class I SAM-dependent methyltransferase n=1 Tax=Pengzhenrongella sicca TaxID=2819238 RepID=A0A8A4Z9Q6_9MICO|nr:class I SAM-dependent methyltransferase [Pengzhenrongella sicca]QTE28205.1 class I SAM-dependent methyltransferase [Pengzhenrongella sicca]